MVAADTSHDYRTFMSAFPTGVTVITARDRHGRPHGITCSSLSSVTLTPPTLLVCIRTSSPTLTALRDRAAFAVNLLHARGRGAAELFSSPVPERFGRVRWQPSPFLDLPWLADDAFAVAECRVVGTLAAGDHEVVLGAVIAARHSPDTPLMYGMRQFRAWPFELA